MPPAALFHFASDSDQDTVEALNDDASQDILRTTRPKPKASGACVDCKSVKVRCETVPGERKCRRCQMKNLPCRSRERKKRKAADTHEELQEKAHSQDRQIEQLLREYDRLLADHKIRQWVNKSHIPSATEGYDRMAACHKWIQSGTSPEDATMLYFGFTNGVRLPEIIKHCELYPEEIVELFSLFFKHVDPYFSIMDQSLHTPHSLIRSSPFLFTVICAVSSRYYVSRPEVYSLAMDFARDAAGTSLVEGKQSVDMCQAYLLMAVYPVPKKKWVEDRSWLLMGVAIRMAMELKLNQPSPPDMPEREKLNRARIWLNCYCVDGSHAIQFGKMPMLRLDDYLARSSASWFKTSSMNTPFDVHLVAYVQILLLMAEWRTVVTAQSKDETTADSEIINTALQTHSRLSREMSRWVDIYAEELTYNPLPICMYRGNTTQMITAYLKLVVLLNGFQAAYRMGLSRKSEILQKALDAARCVIQIMVERLAPTGFLRYAMDANFLYVTYAAAFLINLLRPKLLPLLNDMQRREIILTVTNLITVLGSRAVALDGRHTPALYSRFLSSLLCQHCPASLATAFGAPAPPVPEVPTHGVPAVQDVYYWPDVSAFSAPGPSKVLDTTSSGVIYQQHGDPDMDFSLNHFVKAVSQDIPARDTDEGYLENINAWKEWHLRGEGHSNPNVLNSGLMWGD